MRESENALTRGEGNKRIRKRVDKRTNWRGNELTSRRDYKLISQVKAKGRRAAKPYRPMNLRTCELKNSKPKSSWTQKNNEHKSLWTQKKYELKNWCPPKVPELKKRMNSKAQKLKKLMNSKSVWTQKLTNSKNHELMNSKAYEPQNL